MPVQDNFEYTQDDYGNLVGRFFSSHEEAASMAKWDREYVAYPTPDGRSTYASSNWPGIETEENLWPPHPSTYEYLLLKKQQKGRAPKQAIPPDMRWEVWERDDFRCKGCGSRRFLSVDHIIAESKGGQMVLENLQTLCRPCNSRKGAR